MKKTLFIVLILVICNVCFANKNDSIYISYEEYKDLVKTEKNYITLSKDVEKVNKRVDDWYLNLAIGGTIFIILLAALIGFQWNSARGIARQEAESELENVRESFNEEFENINNMSIEIKALLQDAESRLNTIKNAEKLIMNNIVDDKDEIIEKDIED